MRVHLRNHGSQTQDLRDHGNLHGNHYGNLHGNRVVYHSHSEGQRGIHLQQEQ